MLDIGGVEGGGRIANVHIRRFANAAKNAAFVAHDELDELDVSDKQIALFLVFLYPGTAWTPPRTGLFIDRWLKARRELVIHVGVDDSNVLEPAEARTFVAQQLVAAGELLSEEVMRRKIQGKTYSCHQIIGAVLRSEKLADDN
ncbi:hypothetical protein Rhe02_15800 [Rhizocola hellebori]|uniref:Uncharacterized protein n=1 Tax=Rhizocola hellebori TaxID=1392758 RepID=A0A8J3Q401_9ACTN|nr:hypothetical protein Rhe02_15800 [Rhizocola hellebori]